MLKRLDKYEVLYNSSGIFLFAVAGACILAYRSLSFFMEGSFGDISIFLSTADHFLRGESPYYLTEDIRYYFQADAPIYKFPPPYLLLLIPWVHAFSTRVTYGIFAVGYLVIYLLTVRYILRWEFIKTTPNTNNAYVPALLGFFALWAPYYEGYKVFSPEILILPLFAAIYTNCTRQLDSSTARQLDSSTARQLDSSTARQLDSSTIYTRHPYRSRFLFKNLSCCFFDPLFVPEKH